MAARAAAAWGVGGCVDGEEREGGKEGVGGCQGGRQGARG